MTPDLDWKSHSIIILIALIATFFVLAPYLPLFYNIPERDSGVFIYIGEQVIEGKLPYLDIWDHKGPLIYYINAIGVYVGFHTLYGIWIIQFAFIFLSALTSLYLLKYAFGVIPAIFGTFFWLANLPLLIQGGNLTEEYAILFQFLAILFFFLSEKQNFKKYMFFAGICIGLCIALKPNLIGIFISILIFQLLKSIVTKDYVNPLKSASYLVIGSILPLLAFSLFFTLNGMLYEFIDQYVYYNIIYSSSSLTQKIFSIYSGFQVIFGSGLIISGWILALMMILSQYKTKSVSILIKEFPLIIFSLLLLPLDLILVSSSGRSYNHYYMTILPVFCILFSFFIWFIFNFLKSEFKIKIGSHWINGVSSLIIAIFIPIFLISGVFCFGNSALKILDTNDEVNDVIVFIENNSLASDKVLFWGAETRLNVLLNRNAPTKYVYQYPLFSHGYAKQSIVNEFISDLTNDPPKYIIDTSQTNSVVIPINQSKRTNWQPSDLKYLPNLNFNEFFQLIDDSYHPVNQPFTNGWVVYECNTITLK